MFPLNIWQANNGKDIKRIEQDGKLIWDRCVEQTMNPFVGSRDTALRKLEAIAAMEQGKWTRPAITVTPRSKDTVTQSGDVYTWTGSFYCMVNFNQEIPVGATVNFKFEMVEGTEQNMTYCTWQFTDGTEGKSAFDSTITSAVVPEKPVKALYCYKSNVEATTTQKFRITECAFTTDAVSPATPVSIYGNNGVLGLSENLFNAKATPTEMSLSNGNSYIGIKVTDKAGTYYASAINPNKRGIYYYLGIYDPVAKSLTNPQKLPYFIYPDGAQKGILTLPEGCDLWVYNAIQGQRTMEYIEEMDVMITEGPAQVIYEPYGVTQKQEATNLFDARRTDETGFFINNGAVAEALSSNRTFVFEVKPSTKYSYWHSVGKGGGRCFETAEVATAGTAAVWTVGDKSYMDPNTVVTITTKADTKYLYVCIGRVESDSPPIQQQKDDFVLIEGEPQSTAYIPFGGEQSEATVVGKNLFGDWVCRWVSADGRDMFYPDNSQGYYCSDYIPVKPDTSYVLCANGDAKVSGIYSMIIAEYDANKKFLVRTLTSLGAVNIKKLRSDTAFVLAAAAVNNFLNVSATQEQFEQLKLQFEEGTSATPYQPYLAPQSAPVVDLYAVGTYKDTYDAVSGKVTRRCGAVMWDGSEQWNKNGTTSYYTSVESRVTGMSCPYICSHSKNLQLFMTYNVGFKVSELPESVTDVDTLKAWLKAQYDAGTPVIFVFPLNTETTEQAEPHALVQYRGVTQTAGVVSKFVDCGVDVVSMGEN